MTTANPYAAPSATDVAGDTSAYTPVVFSFNGRIGRLRYLAYGMAWNFVIAAVGAILFGLLALVAGDAAASLFMLGATLIYIAFLVPAFAMAVRRLNDLDRSGWLSLLMLVPLVNLGLMLYLMFGPGTQGVNKYGPAPSANSGLVVVAALILPIIFIVGMLAAVAVPAYQEFATGAQAVQVN